MTPVTMQKKNFSKSFFGRWRLEITMQCKFYTCLMLTLATQDQAERRETTSRAIGGPVSGLVDQTPSTLIQNGSQEDDRGKLIFPLSFS